MRKTFRRSILAAAFGILLPALAVNPSYGQPVAGGKEVEVSGGFFHAQGSDTGALNADVGLGYYLTPGWEIGFRQALNYTFNDDAADAWVATTTPFLNYHFRFGNVVPFLGGFGGIAWNDRDVTGTIGPQAGIKFFFGNQTYLGLRYRYEWFFNSFDRLADNRDDGNHVFNIGIGFIWGGTRIK